MSYTSNKVISSHTDILNRIQNSLNKLYEKLRNAQEEAEKEAKPGGEEPPFIYTYNDPHQD